MTQYYWNGREVARKEFYESFRLKNEKRFYGWVSK